MAQVESSSTPQADPPDDDDGLRKRLLRRVTVAGALVVALLAALALFDNLYVQPEKPPTRVAAVEPPTVSEKPAEAVEERPVASSEAAKEPEAEPERTAEPTGTMPPAYSERALTVPATAHQAMVRPGEPAVAPKPEPAREIARVLPAPRPAKLAATDGKPSAAEAKPMSEDRPIARAVEAAGQFLLQMGVFKSVANAEELRARLELAGIPAQIEARVQVGPFATRQEAEQAREKLKSLGMDPGLIMAARK